MDTLPLSQAVYLVVVNVAGLFFVGQDKFAARSGKKSERRTPEGLLFFLAIIGGSIGVYMGMFLFRHKTQKIYFLIGMPLLMAQQAWLLYNSLKTNISLFW